MPKTNKMIHSIFLGRKVRKFYELKDYYRPELLEQTETLERIKIVECDMNNRLEEKDEIFLHEKGVYTTIQKVTVGTDGNIYYNVSFVNEIIDDTKKTYNNLLPKYSRLQREYEENIKVLEEKNKLNQLKKEQDESYIKEIIEWQQKNLDKIKGIIIQELSKDNNSIFNKEQLNDMLMETRMSVPKEYLVIPSYTKITYLDCSDKNISIEKI